MFQKFHSFEVRYFFLSKKKKKKRKKEMSTFVTDKFRKFLNKILFSENFYVHVRST